MDIYQVAAFGIVYVLTFSYFSIKVYSLKRQLKQHEHFPPQAVSFLDSGQPKKIELVCWDRECDYKNCQAVTLTGCVSGYCHNHCPTKCKCGVGEEAQALIKKYGSLRTAQIELNIESGDSSDN